MKYSKILLKIFAIGALFIASSCDDYLDKMPDNRAELDSQVKIKKLLVSAYPTNDYICLTELSSDNIDDYGAANPYSSKFTEQVAYWKDVTEKDNEAPDRVWSSCYTAISSANMALDAIEKMGNPKELQAAKGEALLCRAYSHFMLVNIFGKHYNKITSATDLGIVYMEKVETSLNPKYQRETVASNYENIELDIEEGLPLINDGGYDVPKYHFNKKAAYAFASRFYLYYEKWDKVINTANEVLTTVPSAMLRDYRVQAALTKNFQVWANAYVSDSYKCNLLLMTAYSSLGYMFGNYYEGSRFAHGSSISATETLQATGPWGAYSGSTYWAGTFNYSATNLNKSLFAKIPALFEYTDPVAQVGYRRILYTALTTDEVLLNRAEAFTMLKKYDEAAADLALWQSNIIKTTAPENKNVTPNIPAAPLVLTRSVINSFYGGLAYYTPTAPTIKKKINPAFTVEAGEQENFVQCVLHFRRIETLSLGLRWFDIKRYGIEVSRRVIDANGRITVGETLPVGDERRAVQIPKDVVTAGLTPNPR